MKSALVIRHVAFEDLGAFEPVLRERGYEIEYVEAGMQPLPVLDPLGPDLVIVLGGPIGVYEDETYPFLGQEIELLQTRLQAKHPTLGICLGAQLMARALGAAVYPGPQKEIGWGPLMLTDEGAHGSLGQLEEGTSVLHWHGDTFDLPQGAVRLASTRLYANQAFAWGENSLALQFHPEVTVAGMERWFIGHAVEINSTPGISVSELRAATAFSAPELETRGRRFFRDWLAKIEAWQGR